MLVRSIILCVIICMIDQCAKAEKSSFFYGNNLITTFEDQQSAIAAASRDDVCTFIMYGAAWDGHFKRVGVNMLERLAIELRDDNFVEVGYYAYDGSLSGPHSIPTELYPAGTIGSYDWYAYRGGKRLWEKIYRKCTLKDENAIDVDCIRRHCAASEEL